MKHGTLQDSYHIVIKYIYFFRTQFCMTQTKYNGRRGGRIESVNVLYKKMRLIFYEKKKWKTYTWNKTFWAFGWSKFGCVVELNTFRYSFTRRLNVMILYYIPVKIIFRTLSQTFFLVLSICLVTFWASKVHILAVLILVTRLYLISRIRLCTCFPALSNFGNN